MSEFDIILAKLKSGGNLGIRTREPKACLLCSSPKALQEYEACYEKTGKFVIQDPEKIKNLTIMHSKSKLSFACEDCGAERVKEKISLTTPVFWVTCGECHQKNLSLIENKCIVCDPEAKKKLEEFEAS